MLGRLALIGIVACILGLACYVYMGSSASSEISSKSVSTDVEKESEIEAADSDSRISVSADNCELKWSCANALNQIQFGFFYKIDGEMLIDNDNAELKSLVLEMDMTEVKANAESLSKKLQGPGFFKTEQYPTARFEATSIQTADLSEHENATHIIEGNLQLLDVVKSIRFPTTFAKVEDGFVLNSEFSIKRRDFGVTHPIGLEDKAIKEDVLLNLNIKTTDTSTASDLATANQTSTAMDVDRFTEEIPVTLAQFEMIRVPGNPESGIATFYIGACEVTWETFDYWALCRDLPEKDSVKMRSTSLRPSAPHDLEAIYRGWGRKEQPVVGVSQKSAKLFCQWLSKQTGKHYRLPTSAEWQHALQSGGDEENADDTDHYWHEGNTFDDESFSNKAMPVGKSKPNELGIFDMLGNVAEWVSDQNHVVGGNFLTPQSELSGDHVEKEDQNIWNANYPQMPKSIWWYKDADYVGFRVVCEVN